MAKIDYYKKTDYFEFTQPNPTEGKKCKKPDCAIRAFAIAADLSWQEAYDILSAIAREDYDIPNSQNVYEKAFAQRGYRVKSLRFKKGGKEKDRRGIRQVQSQREIHPEPRQSSLCGGGWKDQGWMELRIQVHL